MYDINITSAILPSLITYRMILSQLPMTEMQSVPPIITALQMNNNMRSASTNNPVTMEITVENMS